MGWRGTIRAINAAHRRIEREQARERKRLLAARKEMEKMDALERARHEVEEYENLVASLLSVHKQCSTAVDWTAIETKVAPVAPANLHEHEERAAKTLREYSPSFLDRIFKRSDSKRAALAREIELSRQRDADEYKVALAKHGADYAEWEAACDLAKKVRGLDPKALGEALEHFDPFDDLRDIGGTVTVRFLPDGSADVDFQIDAAAAVPTEIKALMKSGKLSTKGMPAAKYWELYQDFVCGCVLRIGRELFAALPIPKVVVTAATDTLNTGTGHSEKRPIVSALLWRRQIDAINFDQIDCSDAVERLTHNMEFKRAWGFAPIERIAVS